MCLVRSFVGDSSDGIPGVDGAGFKTMSKRFPLLQEDQSLMLQDILDEASRHSATKVQLYKNIVDKQDIVRRNWKLMHLDIANLSGDQIKKINDSVSSYSPKKNKLEMMRLLIREGVQDFDVDSFFMTLNATIV
jgi:5'-3' exonuclease